MSKKVITSKKAALKKETTIKAQKKVQQKQSYGLDNI